MTIQINPAVAPSGNCNHTWSRVDFLKWPASCSTGGITKRRNTFVVVAAVLASHFIFFLNHFERRHRRSIKQLFKRQICRRTIRRGEETRRSPLHSLLLNSHAATQLCVDGRGTRYTLRTASEDGEEPRWLEWNWMMTWGRIADSCVVFLCT